MTHSHETTESCDETCSYLIPHQRSYCLSRTWPSGSEFLPRPIKFGVKDRWTESKNVASSVFASKLAECRWWNIFFKTKYQLINKTYLWINISFYFKAVIFVEGKKFLTLYENLCLLVGGFIGGLVVMGTVLVSGSFVFVAAKKNYNSKLKQNP